MKLTGRSAAPRTRVRLAVVAATAALLGLPAVADAAGTVTTDGNTVTYTGSSGADNVSVQYGLFDDEVGGPSVTISTDTPVTNGSPGVCVQPSYTGGNSVSCPRTPSVVADLGAGDDKGTGDDGNETFLGGDGNDHLEGGKGNDTLDGGPGDDGFEGTPLDGQAARRAGADSITGGPGEDYVSYIDTYAGVNVSLDGVANDGPPGEGDNVAPDVEDIYGSRADDTLTGNDAQNKLYGLAGNDTIRGGGGDDLINGERDDDHLYGDAGNDDITGDHGNDYIEGGPGTDRLSGDGCSFDDCYSRSSDTIQARDGERDSVACGFPPDTVTADQNDEVSTDCKNVDRGGSGGGTSNSGPTVNAAVSRKLKLKRVLTKGLPVQVSCDEACSLSGKVKVSGATVARGKKRLGRAGKSTMVLKFTSKARKKLARKRKLKLKIAITAVDGAGNRNGVQGTITLKR